MRLGEKACHNEMNQSQGRVVIHYTQLRVCQNEDLAALAALADLQSASTEYLHLQCNTLFPLTFAVVFYRFRIKNPYTHCGRIANPPERSRAFLSIANHGEAIQR